MIQQEPFEFANVFDARLSVRAPAAAWWKAKGRRKAGFGARILGKGAIAVTPAAHDIGFRRIPEDRSYGGRQRKWDRRGGGPLADGDSASDIRLERARPKAGRCESQDPLHNPDAARTGDVVVPFAVTLRTLTCVVPPRERSLRERDTRIAIADTGVP